ncbi:MAG: succinate dehydrogenase, cytochrome b556 subunit [Alphaproteobacteria bacterium]|nr:succinate dehydrogenase, cytochrome b556 subunit [Alphaproteobacteria bacterium]
MAQVERPLSPHLQVYRPQITSVLSILHRLTGVALAGGAVLLAWWLIAAATGPEAFAQVQAASSHWLGKLVAVGFLWALCYHFCNGVRHLAWDAGWGFDLPTTEKTGWAVVIGSVVLTALAVALAWGGAP